MAFAEYDAYDGLGLADLVRKREATPSELAEEAISRVERLNPQINAVIQEMYDIARTAAAGGVPDGPFHGVLFLLKDLIATYAGVPTRGGSRFFADFVPHFDSEMVTRYKAAGLVTVGKTNTPELGLVPVTEPELFGPTNNPWDITRTPGGSSGGSGAAVAARIVALAHGGDGGGSIRIPASCCGLFGLKPSRGRNPTGPFLSESWQGMTAEHVLTRSVRDSAAALDATAGPDPGAPYCAPTPERPFLDEVGADPGRLRIAFTATPFLPGTVHEDCVRGLEAAVKLCEELGHEVVEATPAVDGAAFAKAFFTMVCCETAAEISSLQSVVGRKATSKDFEPATWVCALVGKRVSGDEYSGAIRTLKNTGRKLGLFFAGYDVLLTPTLASPPVVTGALQPRGAEAATMRSLGRLNAGGVIDAFVGIEALAMRVFEFMPYTPIFNATGQPAMSVPLHWTAEGLPVGVHFAARYGDEATLFRLAAQLEEAAPWADRRPPVCCGE